MQRRAELHSATDDLVLFQRDHGSDNFNLRFWPCANANDLLKRSIVLRPAVGIAGTVFCYRADINRSRADGFSPAHRDRKKMCIAERNVGDRNSRGAMRGGAMRGCVQLSFWNRDVLVRERRTSDSPQVIELRDQAFANAVEVGNFGEGPALALLRPLAVPSVEQCEVGGAMPCDGYRQADTRIHAATEQHHRIGLVLLLHEVEYTSSHKGRRPREKIGAKSPFNNLNKSNLIT